MNPIQGFGGVPHFSNYSKHQAIMHIYSSFPFTGNLQNLQSPEVNGLEGIMQYYQGALQHVLLSGPTYFGPIKDYVSNVTIANINNNIYSVLMILTQVIIGIAAIKSN